MKRYSVPTCLLWLSLSVVAATAEPIRVSVGSDPAFTSFYYASQQKLFEKAGLDVRLSIVTQDAVYRRRAQATLEAFAGMIPSAGLRATTFLAAARETLGAP